MPRGLTLCYCYSSSFADTSRVASCLVVWFSASQLLAMSLIAKLVTSARSSFGAVAGVGHQGVFPLLWQQAGFSSLGKGTAEGLQSRKHGVGGPDAVRPGVRRKNHMKRMKNRFKVTKEQNRVTKAQKAAANERRLEKIRKKKQFLQSIGMTAKEFL
jgi:hypothetical protein